MYERHFNFSGPPFSIAPNPRYVYLSPKHREALAHLLYGISLGGGFIVLTGEVGTGKTTLCRCLMEQLPEDVDIALIFNPRLNARELLASICDELHIAHPGDKSSIKRLIDLLNQHLLEAHARGRRTIVLIDEAQNLSFDVLEQIRLLTNLETNVTKLLQIILVGQPELKTLLARPNLRQLSQRITARYHLLPLSWTETEAYIGHRLVVSGIGRRIFSRLAVFRVFRLAGGIPRLINLICDRALLGAYTLGKSEVGYAIVGKAAREVLPDSQPRPTRTVFSIVAVLALVSMGAGWYWNPAGLLSGPKAWLDAAALKHPAKIPPLSRPGSSPALPENRAPGNPMTGEGKPASALLGGAASNPAPSANESPAAVTQADFEKWLVNPTLTQDMAFSRLYASWGVKVPQGEYDECLLAKQHGLRCLISRGDSARLISLDYPAILEFVLPDGTSRYAALTGLDGQQWVLDMGGTAIRVEAAQWLPYWQGNFILLWKPPYDAPAIIKPGKNSEAVRWIRAQLNAPAAPGLETFFDENLRARVMDFQRSNGLLADGNVGPMTVIQLEKASARHTGPSLSKTQE